MVSVHWCSCQCMQKNRGMTLLKWLQTPKGSPGGKRRQLEERMNPFRPFPSARPPVCRDSSQTGAWSAGEMIVSVADHKKCFHFYTQVDYTFLKMLFTLSFPLPRACVCVSELCVSSSIIKRVKAPKYKKSKYTPASLETFSCRAAFDASLCSKI